MTLCTVLAQVKPLVVHAHVHLHSAVQHNQVYPAVLSGLYIAIVTTHISRCRFQIVNVTFNNACHYMYV